MMFHQVLYQMNKLHLTQLANILNIDITCNLRYLPSTTTSTVALGNPFEKQV